jgi:hypothetical protein
MELKSKFQTVLDLQETLIPTLSSLGGMRSISDITEPDPSTDNPIPLPSAMLQFWLFFLGLLSLLNIFGMSSIVYAYEPSGSSCHTLHQRREW